jgi:Na+/H+ antiporter NhaD/arsenite permease-like protein
LTESSPSTLNLVVFLLIFSVSYILIIKKSFDKNMAAALGALVTMIAGSFLNVFDQEMIISNELADYYIILAILLGNLLMVAVASEVGIFQFISIKLLKFTKGDPKKMYWALGILTYFLSAIVNTISAILIVGALTIVATKELEYNPKSYILMEISVINVAGLTTIISSMTNLIIAIPFGITFLQYSIIVGPFSLFLFLVTMLLMLRVVPVDAVSEDIIKEKEQIINTFNEWSVVKNKTYFKRTAVVFASTMSFLLFSDFIGMEIAVIALGGGLLMIVASGNTLDKILPKIDWALLTFFISLFVIVKGLELVGALRLFSEFLILLLGDNSVAAVIIIFLFSTIFSGLFDNVILAVAFTPVLLYVSTQNQDLHLGGMVWALIIGANIGGGLTPIGAPAGVLGLSILHKEAGIRVGWVEFFKTIGKVTIIRMVFSIMFLIVLVTFYESTNIVGR